MTLSENAARGENIVASTSLICLVAEALPILSLNIISAVLGFGAARLLRNGSAIARNLSIILRIADIPVLAAMLIVSYKFEGETVFKICFIAVVLIAAVDMIIIMSLTSSDSNAYFQEVYEWQQAEQEKRRSRTSINEFTEMTELAELAKMAEQPQLQEQPVQEAVTEQPAQEDSDERSMQTVPAERSIQAAYNEQLEQLVQISPVGLPEQENSEDTAVISDDDKLI